MICPKTKDLPLTAQIWTLLNRKPDGEYGQWCPECQDWHDPAPGGKIERSSLNKGERAYKE